MRGGLSVVVHGTTVVDLETAPPLAAKVLAGPVLVVIGSAAGLLEGDHVSLRVSLAAGARLRVITTAATIAHPCPGTGTTLLDVDCRLGPGARLAWLPEPLIACGRCRHHSRSRISLAAGAVAVWREAFTLGRTGEEPGRVEQRLDAEIEGRPLLRESLGVDPGGPESWRSPVVLGPARHLAGLHLLGRRLPTPVPDVMNLAGPGATIRMVATRAEELSRRLAAVQPLFLDALASAGVGLQQPAEEAPAPVLSTPG